MAETPLRVAVAGAGMIARVHLQAIRRARGNVVGISASSPGRAKAAAAELGLARSFDSSEELVTSPDVDVVHICTPNAAHQPLAELALRSGKHVVCEKPLATSALAAETLASTARHSGLIAAVPLIYRYYPMAAEARARAHDGTLGDVRLIHGHYLQDWLSQPDDNNWRVDPVLGGPSRAFADIGSHWCDLVEWVTGHRIAELTAAAQTILPQRRGADAKTFAAPGSLAADDPPAPTTASDLVTVSTEDAVQVLFRTDRGASGSVTVSQVSPGRKNRLWFEVDGAHASVAFDQENPEILFTGSRPGNATVQRDPAALSQEATRLASLPAGHPMGYNDCFAAFISDVYAAIRQGSPACGRFPTFEDAARMVRLTEAVLHSAHSRSWTEMA